MFLLCACACAMHLIHLNSISGFDTRHIFFFMWECWGEFKNYFDGGVGANGALRALYVRVKRIFLYQRGQLVSCTKL